MATPEEMQATMIANMPETTGKSMDQWLLITRQLAIEKHMALVKHLKNEHGVTHGFANLIAHYTLNPPGSKPAEDTLVPSQYIGKEALKPIYEAVLEAVSHFGDDVEIAPKKAYVSLRRKKQFALVQPSTKTRLDIGLILKGDEAVGRLKSAGSFNAMVTHKVSLMTLADLDHELIGWLSTAYQRAG